MKYPSYPKYKDHGDLWIGRYPSHWRVERAHFLLTSRRRSVTPAEMKEKEVLHYSIPNVQRLGTGAIEDGSNIDSAKTQLFAPTLLASKLNPHKTTVCLARPSSDHMTVASGEFVPIESDEIDLGYAWHLWSSSKVSHRLIAFAQSVTRSHQRVSPDEIIKLEWAWPPRDEQQTIAAFLDRKTAGIDALIEKKRRLLELLEEKRLAIISRAVTKGVDPDTTMRDSDITWLGEVPAHWDLRRVKFVSPKVTVGIVVTPSKYYSEDGVPALRSLNVKERRIDTSKMVYLTNEANELHKKSKIYAGDLVAIRTGQPGTTAVVPEHLDSSNCIDLIIIRSSENIESEFLGLFANTYPAKAQYLLGVEGALQQHFNIDTAKNLLVSVPPIAEQKSIAAWVSEQERIIKSLIQRIELGVEELHEYRSALITNAVTGKIDVRNLVQDEAAA